MHIPDIPKILLPPTLLANRFPPFVNHLQNFGHDGTGERRRTLGEPSDKFVEELLGRNLEMKWISEGLNERLEQGKGEKGDMGITVVDLASDCHRGLPWSIGFLVADVLCELEMDGIVGLVQRWVAGALDVYIDRGGGDPRIVQHRARMRSGDASVGG